MTRTGRILLRGRFRQAVSLTAMSRNTSRVGGGFGGGIGLVQGMPLL